jgi:hypothetical protein
MNFADLSGTRDRDGRFAGVLGRRTNCAACGSDPIIGGRSQTALLCWHVAARDGVDHHRRRQGASNRAEYENLAACWRP